MGHVPEEPYSLPIGKGVIRKRGKDVTVVAISYMVLEAIKAAELLQKEGIDTEIVDPRSLKPLDDDLIFGSVEKTGRLVIADMGWKTGGVAAEISARLVTDCFNSLRAPILRVTLPDTPTPASLVLEQYFYPGAEEIIEAVKTVMSYVCNKISVVSSQ